MTASNSLKAFIAGFATVAVVGTAIAQSNPPSPANPNPATGAGQQSSQNTPMGSTGTQGATGTPQGNTMGSGMNNSNNNTMGSGNSAGSSSGAAAPARPARADRN